MSKNSRAIAASVLASIIGDGKSLDAVLSNEIRALDDQRDRAFVQEMVYGVSRWYWRLLPQLNALLRRPLRARDRDVEMLLLVGLYQLRYLDTPTHAAVDATVAACTALQKNWARALVNGTLRNAIRQTGLAVPSADESPALRTAHPVWFVETVQRDWPNHWPAILEANNIHPPFTLRVNAGRSDRERYLDLLIAAGLIAQRTRYADEGIRIEHAVPVEALPGFAAGAVSVQDEAAQLAASVLQVPAAARVLDACAAPGGKSCHLLETHASTVTLVALDSSASRLDKMRKSMARLGLCATLYAADAAAVETWWDGVPFDRILIDAPCSGSGVIRRHPDIKIHRRPDDVDSLVAQQARLLDALWPLLAVGGKLVYATCSIFKAENDHVIAQFVTATDDAKIDHIDADWGMKSECGRQIITGDAQMDGFYYARLTRTSSLSAAPGITNET